MISKLTCLLAASLLVVGTVQTKGYEPRTKDPHFKGLLEQMEQLKKLKQSSPDAWVEPTMVHIVPHSYNTEFLATVD